jgi:hypothetical protein
MMRTHLRAAGKQLELVIDGGACSMEPTTVIDLTGDDAELVRQGRGDASCSDSAYSGKRPGLGKPPLVKSPMNETDSIIQTITVYLIPVLFAISLHEAAHGYVARYFGDPTAADSGA